MNAGNKNTPSTHHPGRRNVTTLMVGLKQNRSHTQKSHPKVVNPRDIAGEHQKNPKKQKQKKKEEEEGDGEEEEDCLLVACLTSQQQASVSQGRICSNNFTCCHTEIEVADQTFYLTQSQYTDTGLTSPSADPLTPGAWQGSHWSANVKVTGMTRPRKNPGASGIRTRDLPLSRRTP